MVPSTATLTFAPGETGKTITIPINGDTIAEADETFAVQLSALTNATFASTTASRATVTLTNDDQPSLNIANVPIAEGNNGTNNATVTVTLSSAALSAVTVNYATSDGTATPVIGDFLMEAPETVLLTLSNPTGAILGTTATAYL